MSVTDDFQSMNLDELMVFVGKLEDETRKKMTANPRQMCQRDWVSASDAGTQYRYREAKRWIEKKISGER